jgi:hypothetical protein
MPLQLPSLLREKSGIQDLILDEDIWATHDYQEETSGHLCCACMHGIHTMGDCQSFVPNYQIGDT